jgi:hypothetical protein
MQKVENTQIANIHAAFRKRASSGDTLETQTGPYISLNAYSARFFIVLRKSLLVLPVGSRPEVRQGF